MKHDLNKPPRRRIAILGAGPIGLEAAIYARTLGHDVAIYEKGPVAAHVQSWGFVNLFTPWRMNTTPLGIKLTKPAVDLNACPTAREVRDKYLLPLAHSDLLHDRVHTETHVIAVGREDYFKADAIGKPERSESPFRILLRASDGREWVERADVVLDCTGVYSHHRWAGRGGIPAPGELALRDRIDYRIPDILGRDSHRFVGRHTLVIGAGLSAATVIADLCQAANLDGRTHVTWATRRESHATRPLEADPLPQRQGLIHAVAEIARTLPPWIHILANAPMEHIAPDGEGFAVTLAAEGGSTLINVANVVCLVGYAPDASIYEQLQIHQCYATAGPIKLAAALLVEGSSDCLSAGSSLSADTLANPEPGFFILGAKSYGSNPHFLMRTGHRQIRDVFSLIEGPNVDLYGDLG